jgi:hypothetical protein
MLKRFLVSCSVVLGAIAMGCGGESGGGDLPQKPQIMTDRDSIVDTMFVNQQRTQTLQVTNKGLDDLVVSGYTLAGDSAVALVNATILQGDGSSSNTIKSNKTGFISMTCQLASAGSANATLTISSNAENKPSKVVTVTCNAQNQ